MLRDFAPGKSLFVRPRIDTVKNMTKCEPSRDNAVLDLSKSSGLQAEEISKWIVEFGKNTMFPVAIKGLVTHSPLFLLSPRS